VHLQHPEGSARNVWHSPVSSLEARGDLVRLEVEGPPALTAVITPAAVADLGLHEGADVWLTAKATDLDVYPA
jgi:molybdate transport system ATP-binding protein